MRPGPFPRFRDALHVIPPKWRDLFRQYFTLATKHKSLDETKWKQSFSMERSSFSSKFSNPNSIQMFEKNPITYLIHAHNSLVDFSSALNQVLKMLYHQKKVALSEETFLILLDKVRNESETRNRLTPALKDIFRTLVLYPLASLAEIASEVGKPPQLVQQHIDRFKNRFLLYRIVQQDYYKFGLSRVFLFLTFKNRRHFSPLPVTQRYFENEIMHRLDVFSYMFSIQRYRLPKSQWSAFKKLCEAKYTPEGVDWLGGVPQLFFATDANFFYNTETYDKSQKRWVVDENYLEFCLSTGIWETIPRADISPSLQFGYDMDGPRREFDLLDLKIIHYFYELEGNNNRFATTGGVAKELGVPFYDVQTRLQRLLETKMITFYYWTAFRLPRSVDVILLTEDPKLCDAYLNLTTLFPSAFSARIRSYPSRLEGIYSTLYLPHGTRIPYIFRDFLMANQEILTGFCAETPHVLVPTRPLWENWDPIRKNWKWNDLPEN